MAFIFLSHGVPLQDMTVAAPFNSNPDHGLSCRAGGTQHGDCGQSLIIDLRHEERFRSSTLLPDLTNPDLLVHNRHTRRVVRTTTSVNCLPSWDFQAISANLFVPSYI